MFLTWPDGFDALEVNKDLESGCASYGEVAVEGKITDLRLH